jgi:general nucleoside transport system permease protein
MLATSYLIFSALGKSPAHALYVFFLKPVESVYGWSELTLKATPLILCALGLSVGFRANVWNIGAEGQLTVGAITGGGAALALADFDGRWVLPVVLAAGVLGGMLWAALPALLRTRFRANEILTSLMLVYIARLLLGYLVRGPWRDPQGFNFPHSQLFQDATLIPRIEPTLRANWAFVLALVLAVGLWFLMERTVAGFRMQVSGLAPAAAGYAGFGERRNVWLAMLIGGATAGLAGVGEVAGPIGQLQPTVSPGYGFAAIIVAFVGRLNAGGVVLAGLFMSLLYLGGEVGQIDLALPSAVTGLFQGLLLFFLLAADLFVNFRIVPHTRQERLPPIRPASQATAAPPGSDVEHKVAQ